MKLALIAIVSCMALSVKSLNFAEKVAGAVPGADNYNPVSTAFLPYYDIPDIPVMDVQSTDLICRSPDMTAAVTPFSIDAGNDIRIWFNDKKVSPYAGIPPVGPCSFWLAPVASNGVGKVWTKIHEYTNDGNEKTNWCSAKIVNNGGYYQFTIPSEITPGTYILRTELIDILGASKTNYDDFTMGPRFHSNCLVVKITGKGTSPLKNPVSIMDVYKPYNKTPMLPTTMANSAFKLPGPPAYTTGKP
ncbi:hypothetical protein FBU31_001719 [Coemansia sp. 'formosensis']|nr:hypothetical protein FBU31_001719 [Coemansia sp. 'formosensis']